MGDSRHERPDHLVAAAPAGAAALRALSDTEVIEALAAASQRQDADLAKVLASEALDRVRRKDLRLEAAERAERRLAALEGALAGRDGPEGRERPRKEAPWTALLRTVARVHGPGGGGEPGGAVPPSVEDRYRRMIGSVKDYAIFMLDPTGYIVTWNEGARRLKGYEPEEIIGEHFSRFYTEPDRERGHPQEVLDHAVRDGRYEEEGWRVRKDGTRFWADIVITALLGEDGKPWGFAKVTRDLTERMLAEEELRASEQRFRLLVQSTLDYAIFMLDTEGRIASWNEGARRLKGYEPEEIIGEHFSRFYGPQDVAADHPRWELEQAVRDGRYEEEGWRIRKDGTRFWANVVITALRDEAGRHIGFSKVTRDLTERKLAEESIRDLNRELTQRLADLRVANEELESFSYSVSHDLRAPLRGIDYFSALLEEEHRAQLDAEGQAHLQQVRRESARAAQLVNDLLTLSRATRGEVRKEPVDLSALAREVADELQRTQPERRVEWVIAGGLTVEADPQLLRIVLQNLLGNAWKYTGKQPDPRIEVGAGPDGSAPFYVKDNGAGFDASHVDRLFHPFQRLHVASEFEGTGIGLTTVKRIVERHGGRVWAEGEPGRGATFSFTL